MQPNQAEGLAGSRNARVTNAPTLGRVFLGFNQRRSPFDDLRVRRARTLAIDRQQILDAVPPHRPEPVTCRQVFATCRLTPTRGEQVF
jgi:ABC-type transport system substrate-binding protein